MKKRTASVLLNELDQFISETLKISSIPSDSSNNGIQVEGNPIVKKAVFGVDACAEVFNAAAAKKADFVFVHHGLSWKDSFKRIKGLLAKRVGLLMRNNITLYGVHLPLDADPEYGHNARLADMIGLKKREMFWEYSNALIGVKGELARPQTAEKLAEFFDERLDSDFKIFGNGNAPLKKIGIISGGAGTSAISEAAEAGLDCLVTGEVTHESWHAIKESGIKVLALGHYASEQPGVWAMMELINSKFGIECEFIESPTGL